MSWLDADEPAPVDIVNPGGSADAVLLCDHASPRLPRRLGDLGLSEAARLDHIGWDIGAAAVARRLSALIDAPLVLTGYSRLAIDCNRPAGVPTSIPALTGGIAVPGNQALTAAARQQREDALFHPYHRAIADLLDRRRAAGRRAVVLAIHSFTPNLGAPRPWQIGITYGRDRRLAGALIDVLRRDWPALTVGDNQPYAVTDSGDYAMPIYGERRGNLHALIEMRNDGLRDEAGQAEWAGRLAACWQALAPALGGLDRLPVSSGP
ncbi:N-formylglutamate amidohydrolase [Zavarzinia compransoris]|uniref:N-formylglutamate amidohydrolase n=1 Tax=Zavarzinia compransoris TaxID=1264899 RepID=A0A317EAX9_9PROT|nr:N-formylglutamate amidohydrolase [Zavarzinia compransoris]PWR22453.1 N-formylglutamate amidohydrolase [Zavarzinia compransoris]